MGGQAQPILLAHVEVGAGYLAAYRPLGRLHPAILEVHQHLALAVLVRLAVPVGEAVVGPIAVHLADGGEEVVHVPLHLVELVALAAVLAPALLPALELVAELPGGDHVLPLDARGAIGLLARQVAAALPVGGHLLAAELDVAAAIEGGGVALIELVQILLGGAKGLGLQGRADERQADEQADTEGEQRAKHEDPWQ